MGRQVGEGTLGRREVKVVGAGKAGQAGRAGRAGKVGQMIK